MRTNRSAWVFLSLVLCLVGGYLVFDSVCNPGHLAEGCILLGGTLIALAVFPLRLAVDQHRRSRALARHMGHVRKSKLHEALDRVHEHKVEGKAAPLTR